MQLGRPDDVPVIPGASSRDAVSKCDGKVLVCKIPGRQWNLTEMQHCPLDNFLCDQRLRGAPGISWEHNQGIPKKKMPFRVSPRLGPRLGFQLSWPLQQGPVGVCFFFWGGGGYA